MAALDVAALVEPLAADEPCGPDLDLEGDPDFLQAVARIEGLMPASYFTRDEEGRQQVFDRASIDIPAEIRILTGLLARTRDLRLLTLVARLSALNRDLAGLAGGVAAVAALLQTRWADVHPRGEDGDYGLRSAVLQALDDMPAIVLPLQHIPLAESRRFGAVSFRSVMVAEGEATAAEGSEAIDRAAIDRTLADCDLDALRAKRAAIGSILDGAGLIYTTMVAEASFAEAVNLERLTALSRRIATLLDTALAGRDPGATLAAPADGPPEEGAPEPVGRQQPAVFGAVGTLAEAAAALAAVAGYLSAFEPSNPAEILVRQARALIGKSFLDVLRILVPNSADDAKIGIGADRIVELSFGQLAAVQEASDEGPDDVSDDAWGGAGEAGPAPDDGAGAASATRYAVGSRKQAGELMQKVAVFYRSAEPSSPIPLLLERALAILERDFLSILKDVLPALARRSD